MSDDIARKVELWLCAELRDAIPSSRAVPSRGGDESAPADTDQIEPPFSFVKVTEALDGTPAGFDGDVWQLKAKVARVSHMDETSAPEHSGHVRQFREALKALCVAVRGGGYYPPLSLTIHGMEFDDAASAETVQDETEQGHGDVFNLVLGASG